MLGENPLTPIKKIAEKRPKMVPLPYVVNGVMTADHLTQKSTNQLIIVPVLFCLDAVHKNYLTQISS